MTESTTELVVTFTRAGLPERRIDWIRQRLHDEVLTAVMRLVAAHPDVRFVLDGEDLLADQPASRVDLLATDAVTGGAVDGRTTAEIAAAIGFPRQDVHRQLALPASRLVLGSDNRWWPKGGA
jgi:hypothetical protein